MSTVPLDFGDLISEAVERAGLDPAALTHRHLNSINRSMQLLLIELETDGGNAEYRMETQSYTITSGKGGVVLDDDTIDVTQATLSIDGKPVPLGRSTREDFLNLSFPTATGSPSIFFLMKSNPGDDYALPTGVTAPPATNNTPVLVVWPQMGLSGTVAIQVTRLRQHVAPTAFSDTLDTRRNWLPTMCAGLAAKIAEKFNPAEEPQLAAKYQILLQGRKADENLHPVFIGYRGYGFGRHRRH